MRLVARVLLLALIGLAVSGVGWGAGGSRDLLRDPDAQVQVEEYVQMKTERRVALVIGNSDYWSIPDIAGARANAGLVSQALRETGFKVFLEEDLQRHEMIEALERVAASLQHGDVFVLYYSGHGATQGGAGRWFPTDIPAHTITVYEREFGLSLKWVLGVLERTPARIKIVISDVHVDFNYGARYGSDWDLCSGLAERPTDVALMCASSAGSAAYDGDGRAGPLAASLVRSMAQPKELKELFEIASFEVKTSTSGARSSQLYVVPSVQRFFFTLPSPESFLNLKGWPPRGGASPTSTQRWGNVSFSVPNLKGGSSFGSLARSVDVPAAVRASFEQPFESRLEAALTNQGVVPDVVLDSSGVTGDLDSGLRARYSVSGLFNTAMVENRSAKQLRNYYEQCTFSLTLWRRETTVFVEVNVYQTRYTTAFPPEWVEGLKLMSGFQLVPEQEAEEDADERMADYILDAVAAHLTELAERLNDKDKTK